MFPTPEPTASTARLLNTTAAILLASTIPYSLIFLEPIIKKLEEKARTLKASDTDEVTKTSQPREDNVHWLVDRWATVNIGRGLMAGVAAACAIWAGVGGIRVAGVEVLAEAGESVLS